MSARKLNAVEQKIHQSALANSDKILTQKDAEKLVQDVKSRTEAINFLLGTGLLKVMSNSAGQLSFRAVAKREMDVTKDMSGEEAMVLGHIKAAANEGIWTKHLKAKTELHQTVIDRCLKSLVQKQLVKSIKAVRFPTRKIYMLAHLEPSVELTGGPWYTDNELDTEFIKLLSAACLHYIRERSFPKPAKRTNKDRPDQFRLYAPGAAPAYPSSEEIQHFLSKRKIANTELGVEHVEMLLKVLELDGEIEKIPAFLAGTWGGQADESDESDSASGSGSESGSDSDSDGRSTKKRKRKASSSVKRDKKRRRRDASASESESDSEDISEDESPRKKASFSKKNGKGKKRSRSDDESGGEESGAESKSKKRRKRSNTLSGSDEDASGSGDDDDEDTGRRSKKRAKSKSRSKSKSKSRSKKRGADSDSDDTGSDSDDSDDSEPRSKSKSRRSKAKSKAKSKSSKSLKSKSSKSKYKFKREASPPDGVASAFDDMSGGAFVYRAVRQERLRLGWSQAPCGACPVFDFCHEKGPTNPVECIYYDEWFSIGGNSAGADNGNAEVEVKMET
ncbi:hypothetical protein CONPUDRAFT_144945 [Coniophora puteana RWD-64-598 SS2]|uniref:DNA-directed RNA polymerase III subunit RPC6 n=1 Tax=Coniophora puteana (strain RWD-64-598) TaxID=741705 RepID=A0A5M3MM87_CONPW|nr:uncharacterized protein CONPUDRAFT_144945 [Coniophora puteana RWD-64-598 SS2]EIW79795.1 hypothetical protein CONPUDRAFT_144945 [Coniophora puteana RWD-64-598 SS2]